MKKKLEKFIKYITENPGITVMAITVIYLVIMFYFLISHLG
jgi:hypothetical protein